MTEQQAPPGTTRNLPPPSADDTAPLSPQVPRRRTAHTRISGIRTALIAGIILLIVVLIFIIQNAHAVNISFMGAHLRLSLAVALLLAAITGAAWAVIHIPGSCCNHCRRASSRKVRKLELLT